MVSTYPTPPSSDTSMQKSNYIICSNQIIGTGRHSEVYTCRRADIAANAPGNLFAVKKIIRADLQLQIFLTPVEMEMTTLEEDIQSLKRRKMHHMVKECCALQSLAGIDHVLQYVDREWTPNYLNIITEFAAGGDLERRFSNLPVDANGSRQCYSENQLIPMFRTLCKTMAKVHGQEWIHRDLKPSNILFRDDTYDRLVIGDFGFASMFATGRSDLTTTDDGSTTFRAPEQINRGAHGYPADMWALGVICYYLLKRRHPLPELERGGTITPGNALGIDWMNVGPLARDFMEKLIVLDPKQRMSALDATSHRWLL